MMTPWGYDIDYLEPLMSVNQFNEMTGGQYAGNARVESALLAASQAVRNYCGWHICPQKSCTAYPEGGGVVAKLPAAYVSGITEVVDDDTEITSDGYEWRRDGLIKRSAPYRWSDKWSGLKVTYAAGYSISAVPDLAEAVRSIAEGVLAVSAGVSSESADGVTIAYRESASSIANSLTASMKDMLASYKVVTAHAT
jgi:hypothetical protein